MNLLSPGKWLPAGLSALALCVGGCTTYGTGVSPAKQTVEDIAGIASLGGKKTDPIDYEPRAPIVAPPKAGSLPDPETTGTVAANWPRDPDELDRQRKAAASSTKLDPEDEALTDPGFRLPKRDDDGPRFADTGNSNDEAAKAAMLKPGETAKAKQLFAAAKNGSAGKVDANGNPVRTTLTEPPATYRVPDPSAPQEYTTKAKPKKWWWPFGGN